MTWPFILLAGAANRYRGESRYHWGPVWAGDTVRRILVAVAVGLVCIPNWKAQLAMLVLWPGLLIGWARYQDMGAVSYGSGAPKVLRTMMDFLGMCARGLVLTAPAGGVLWWLGYGPWFAISGALMGPIYLGCALTLKWGSWGPFKGLRGYTEWAELLVGLWLGTAAWVFVR